jgi:hypothetical protein
MEPKPIKANLKGVKIIGVKRRETLREKLVNNIHAKIISAWLTILLLITVMRITFLER